MQTHLLPLQEVNEMYPAFPKAWWSTSSSRWKIGVFICTTSSLSVYYFAQIQGNFESKAILSVQRARVKKTTKLHVPLLYIHTFPVPLHSPLPLQSKSIPHPPPAGRCQVSRRLQKIHITWVPPLTMTFWLIEDLCRQTALRPSSTNTGWAVSFCS